MKKRQFTSRRRTPWDSKNELSPIQVFIKNKYEENYISKHPKLIDTDEKNIINSIDITECRNCNSNNIIRYGRTKNLINRYYCNDCKSTFTALTNTIFDGHKIPITEWIEYSLGIFNYGSTTLTSKVNKNSLNTSIYWLKKMFILLDDWQENIILEGKVYIDEIFYKVIKSDVKTKNGKQPRGLSKNQYCIGIGFDGKNITAKVEGLGKTSTDLTLATFSVRIKEGSRLMHDDEKSHKKLVNDLELTSESYKSTWLKTLKDEENPLRPINHQCDLLRQFLNTHSGFDRDDLQNYLNLYCFINSGHKERIEKVEELLSLALTKKVKLKYREVFNGIEKNH